MSANQLIRQMKENVPNSRKLSEKEKNIVKYHAKTNGIVNNWMEKAKKEW